MAERIQNEMKLFDQPKSRAIQKGTKGKDNLRLLTGKPSTSVASFKSGTSRTSSKSTKSDDTRHVTMLDRAPSTFSHKSVASKPSKKKTTTIKSSMKFRVAYPKLRHPSKSPSVLMTDYDPEQEYQEIINEIMHTPRQPQDWTDESIQPSYTNLMEPVDRVDFTSHPLHRYLLAVKRYRMQFQQEIAKLARHQARASDAVHFLNIVYYTTFWPPVHTRRELVRLRRYLPQITQEERQRVQYLLKHKIE